MTDELDATIAKLRDENEFIEPLTKLQLHAMYDKALDALELARSQRNFWIEHIDLLMNTQRQIARIKNNDAQLFAALKENKP